MNCHDQTIPRELALAAHNVPAGVLSSAVKSEANIACAACHREHHGADFDLTALGNDACQACHERRYRSLASDHPDFGAWPYERRTRIAFDHASHQARHFADKEKSFDCRQCHLLDAQETGQLTLGYESTCASCHDERIATSAARGVPMLVLPTLDGEVLRAAGHEIGPWPESATGDFDGRLPPMMKLLLAGDPAAATAMTALGEDFEFLDIDPDDESQLAACADLATAIKMLLADVSRRGPAAVRERLAKGLGRAVADSRLDSLVAGLSADTVRGAVAAWLPDLITGPATWSAAEGAGFGVQSPQANAANDEPAFAPAGSWNRDDATLSIRYHPAAHADPVLTSWLELLADTPKLEARLLELAMFKELARPTAPGLCTSCHSVERTAQHQLAVNWRAYDVVTRMTSFTKFSHGPHLTLPQLADCTHCHAVDTTAAAAGSYADWNPQSFASEFRPLSKRQCVECHTATAAGDRCQSCHNYHVDFAKRELMY
jgi:hypothetical protein